MILFVTSLDVGKQFPISNGKRMTGKRELIIPLLMKDK